MLIDSCASGGRRNDLETLRRAVPLLAERLHHRAGRQPGPHLRHLVLDAVLRHGHRLGRDHALRAAQRAVSRASPPASTCGARTSTTTMLRRVLGQWRQYAPYYFGDYYPLTPYSLDPKVWIAWQFDCPEQGEGMVQAFRRAESVYESARFTLRGLDARRPIRAGRPRRRAEVRGDDRAGIGRAGRRNRRPRPPRRGRRDLQTS